MHPFLDLRGNKGFELIQLNRDLDRLLRFSSENRLDFIRWEDYPEQGDIFNQVMYRLRDRSGPISVFPVLGSNRSGKTELGAGVVGQIFKEFSHFRVWAATLSDMSVKVQQRKLDTMIRKSDIKYGEYDAVRGWKNRVITSTKGGVCYFKTYEQGSGSFQGDDIDFAWLDEECPWSIFAETVIRLTDRNGVILLTFTSLSGFTRLVNLLWESNESHIAKLPILKARNNPYLTEAQKAQLRSNIDPDELESRWEGNPHLKQGLIYKMYSSVDHRIPRFDYNNLVLRNSSRWSISEGIDPHERTPHHWLRFLYDSETDTLYVVEELKAPRESMLVSDFSILIKHKRSKLVPEYTQIDTSSMKPDVIYKNPEEDQTDVNTVRLEFQRCGISTVLVTKDNATGIDAVKGRLKISKNIEGLVMRKPKLVLFDDLPGINWEFTRYSWDSYASDKISEKKELINSPKKKDDHFMDILKYECIKRKFRLDLERPEEYEEQFEGMGY